MKQYQLDRLKIIKEILPLLGEKFILKGGTALNLYYGLNRYSEDIDLDAVTNNMDITKKLSQHKDFKNWNINVKKNTDMVFRIMIDYGATSNLGTYPLKIEISSRNKDLIRQNYLTYNTHNGINVYNIKELINMKLTAFNGRDKVRDFFDIAFLLDKYSDKFNNDNLINIRERIYYYGIDELDLLLDDEFKTNILQYEKDSYIGFSQKVMDKIDSLLNLKTTQINDLTAKANLVNGNIDTIRVEQGNAGKQGRARKQRNIK